VGKRNKLPGHYCWVCGRQRPNERFSGKGHSKHICQDCSKLGAEELAYLQNVRNLERCVTWEGFIRRKQRAEFETFLQHDDPRVRAMAEDLKRADSENRERSRAEWEADELAAEVAHLDGENDDGYPF